MSTVVYVVVIALAVGLACYFLARFGRSYFKLRGKRLVTCPETHQPAAVSLEAGQGALKAVIGVRHLWLSECSRWPERQGCGQECLKQIELAPEACLVRLIVTNWYAGKPCAVCLRTIDEVEWLGHNPALMDPEGKAIGWEAVAPEKLPEVFSTYRPVCWDCNVAETLRREHPELVTERPWTWRP